MKSIHSAFAFGLFMTLATSCIASQTDMLDMATLWFENETQLTPNQYRIIAPDRRFNDYSCNGELLFKFPFKNNQRTIQVSCNNPPWKRFLKVNEEDVELHPVLANPKVVGSIITKDDIEFRPINTDDLTLTPLSVNQIIGKRLVRTLDAGQPLSTEDLETVLQVFQTTKAYQIGEIIQKNEINVLQLGIEKSDDALIEWPTDMLIARKNINARQTISITDADIADEVIVTTTILRPGTPITEDNVVIRVRPIDDIPKTSLNSQDQVEGLQTTRLLRKGEILRQTDLVIATYFEKGDPVVLTIARGLLTVTVDTIALEDGQLGEKVQLQNIESGKIMTGIVSGRFKANSISQ